MKLITKAIAKKLPALYATDGVPLEDKVAPLKIFDPCGRATWYVFEWDGQDTFFCYCVSPLGPDCDELGYASLSELSGVRNRLGLGMERDRHWTPVPMKEVLK
jgi:hypothetical protein